MPMLARNLNEWWASALVAALHQAGAREAVVCPGSRSGPVALACADHSGLRTWSVIDERSAAFFALGLAKQSGRAALLVCTSGTAGANFYPAVVEASASHVPLVVITADRPTELHGWGALQSIPQGRLYGEFPRWFVDLGVPEATPTAAAHLGATGARAVAAAMQVPRGVVHLNAPFRDPLAPTPDLSGVPLPDRGQAAFQRAPQLADFSIAPGEETLSVLRRRISEHRRGVIVCGPRERADDFPEAVIRLAARAGYPVLAEAGSQLRFSPGAGPTSISLYDTLLRHRRFAEQHRPEIILRFGGGLISKVLQSWLDASGAETIVFSEDGSLVDPNHSASWVLRGEVAATCRALGSVDSRGPIFGQGFVAAERRGRLALEGGFASSTVLSEPRAAYELAARLPLDANLVVSNSMPARDLDAFAPSSSRRFRVFANRGANGIDGVISTALGVAAASQRPTVLLAGDLALLHDLGALLTAKLHRLSLTIVLLNNDGGGIFSFLPIAQFPAHFESLFGTPHRIDFSLVARTFGMGYRRPATPGEFGDSLENALEGGPQLIEVRTDRAENVIQHRQLVEALLSAMGEGPWA